MCGTSFVNVPLPTSVLKQLDTLIVTEKQERPMERVSRASVMRNLLLEKLAGSARVAPRVRTGS